MFTTKKTKASEDEPMEGTQKQAVVKEDGYLPNLVRQLHFSQME